jgi:hypothetical protein
MSYTGSILVRFWRGRQFRTAICIASLAQVKFSVNWCQNLKLEIQIGIIGSSILNSIIFATIVYYIAAKILILCVEELILDGEEITLASITRII